VHLTGRTPRIQQLSAQRCDRGHSCGSAGLPVTVITTVSRGNLHELPLLRDQLAEHGGLLWQIQAANGPGGRLPRELMLQPIELVAVARLIEETRRTTDSAQLTVAAGHNIGHHACSVRNHSAAGTWRGCPGGITAVGIARDGAVKGCYR